MTALTEFGITPIDDIMHRQIDRADFLSDSIFFTKAEALLNGIAPYILNDYLPHIEYNERLRWNPGGFIVDVLGECELGQMRVHYYPEDEPRKTEVGPTGHDHRTLLASQTILNCYQDCLCSVRTVRPNDPAALRAKASGEPLPRLFTVRRTGLDQDKLVSDGRLVVVTQDFHRVIPAHRNHRIVNGAFHLPEVPEGELTVTAVIDSPAFTKQSRLWFPEGQHPDEDFVISPRRLVTAVEFASLKRQIARATALQFQS